MARSQTTVAILAALVALAAVPAGAMALSGSAAQTQANSSTVNVSTGQQLSTVLSVTSGDVQTEVDETAFEVEYENGTEEHRAEAIAQRAEALRERAEAIREAYEEATEAYDEGELTKSEYAQQLATLNARAEHVANAYDRLSERAANVSALELRAAGLNRTAAKAALSDLESVRGAGASALLKRFTGESRGEVKLETADGLSIAVESEDGERSREFERPGDDSSNLTVSQSDALDTARSTLSDANGTWSLAESKIDRESGTYEFTFRFDSNATEGESEIVVDGSSGKVVSLEEELEPKGDTDEGHDGEEDESDESDDEERDGELALVLVRGTLAANETVTVQALADGEPAAGVTVTLDGRAVGETDGDGTLRVTLPDGGEVELRATRGESEGELEFDLGGEDEREEREVYRKLSADTTLDDDTVTVTVTYDGSGVANASVYANDRRVGTTGSDGVASFDVPNGTEELEVTVVKGEFEAEFEFRVENGTLVGGDDAEESDEEKEGDDAEESDEETEDEGEKEADDEGEEEIETEDDEDDGETETPEP